MSRGLSPRRPSYRLSYSRAAPVRVPAHANDNLAAGRPGQSEAEIRAALAHFARYHLNAAQDAHAKAVAAMDKNNDADFVFWANICRALDRRLADTLTQSREWQS